MQARSDSVLSATGQSSVVFGDKKRVAPYENTQKTDLRTLECDCKSISIFETVMKARFQSVDVPHF